MQPLQIAILAAGKGKRMHSALPKVLHTLAGKPLLAHVLATARAMSPRAICVVEGTGDAVRQRFPEPDLLWARQDPPRGTGDALRCALSVLPPDGVTLVLFGADPLARAATLAEVVEHARRGALSLLTVDLDDPAGYGRIVRSADGTVAAIVEHNEATPEQQTIREVNTGVMAAPTAAFVRWLAAIRADNAVGEYFLTDVIALAVSDGVKVATTSAPDVTEGLGVNSRRDLAAIERRFQRLQAEALLDAGVTLADPARIDVRGTLACGRDVAIDPGCLFEGAVSLADDVVVGPNCVIRNAQIGPGTRMLVYGASGSIGTAGVQLAKHYGAHVTAVCNTKNLELVRSLGADEVIDYLHEDFTKNGERYDVVFDAVGKKTFRQCRGSLSPGGIYVPTDGFMNAFWLLWTRKVGDKKVKAELPPRYLKEHVLFLKELIEAGAYRAVIDRVYPLDDVVEATRYVETQQKTGNVVLTVSGS